MADGASGSGTVLGTSLRITDYESLIRELQARAREASPFAVEFANTHVVTLRRRDAWYRGLLARFDLFVPDGMPLVWCLNAAGAGMRDRVYGPTFMRRCLEASPAPWTHYLVGGSEECGRRLVERMTALQPGLRIAGEDHRLIRVGDDTPDLVADINARNPDFIWVGLGAPKQNDWIARHKDRIARGVLLAVGFAFDVNAGTKPDAPAWMQRLALTWLFRLLSEPRRMAGRYLKFNALFLYYLVRDRLFPAH